MPSLRRKKLFIDNVQSVLIVRVIAYWLFCLLATAMMACCWVALADTPTSSGELFYEVGRRYGVVFIATLLLLPLVVMDVLRLSNRFVGPVFRLRTALKEAAAGQEVRPIQFRENDFWREVADDFNRALALRASDQQPTNAA